MFKFLVLCVFLWLNIGENTGLPADNLKPVIDFSIPEPTINDTSSQGVSNYHGSLQLFFNGPFYFNAQTDGSERNVTADSSNKTQAMNITLNDERLTWNEARKACSEKGGYLAVIKTFDDIDAIRTQMMAEEKIQKVWIGVHNRFDKQDWVTVHDEPLNSRSEWIQWVDKFPGGKWSSLFRCVLLHRNGDTQLSNCSDQEQYACRL